MSKISQIEIQENSDGESFFEIPPALLEDLGWKEGDDVKFIDNKNGCFTIKKVKYETIELDFDDDELLKYMKLAHDKGMSFNEFVEDALIQMIATEALTESVLEDISNEYLGDE